MVYYSERAENDLYNILVGLANWEKHPLEYDHVTSYLDELQEVCNRLDQLNYHSKAKFQTHRQFGDFAYMYRRNRNTTWYIIYDYDEITKFVYIKHIMPNHTSLK